LIGFRRSIVVAALGISVAAAAALAAEQSPAGIAAFIPGRSFGLGEQQVYAIQVRETLVLRFRTPPGKLVTQTLRANSRRSVAFTVEGFNAAGAPVLAYATSRLSGGRTPSGAALAAPPPSPTVGADGTLSDAGAFADIAPAAAIIGGLSGAPQLGATWHGTGDVRLPLARVSLRLTNTSNASSGSESNAALVVASTGAAAVSGTIRAPQFGGVRLRGGGIAGATSYLDPDRGVLLGTQLSAKSQGNADAGQSRGAYTLNADISIELVKFVPGTIPASPLAGFAPASGYLGGAAPTDTANFGPAPLTNIGLPVPANNIGSPAPVDTEYAPTSQPAATPTPQPGISMLPIPVTMPPQQLVSPPPGPSPTPTPRHG